MQFVQRTWLPILVAFFVGVIIPSPFHSHLSFFNSASEFRASSDYQFINPLLGCSDEPFDHIGNDDLVRFEDDLHALTASQKASKTVSDVGVYFRQLNGGPWVGVDESEEFTPGSLLKVPLAMSIFRKSETDPTLLQSKVLYESEDKIADKHFTNIAIEPGQVYTVEALVEAMLTRSDNDAAILLSQIIGPNELSKSYSELGIRAPTMGSDYTTTVRTYASFFRVLYNATYLTNESSEKVLETLTRSTFKDGLVAGIPSNIKVAHKFGERTLAGAESQLHDCGVVYHPERPYLLCVMTRGQDFAKLAEAIRDISKLVYDHVD